MLVDENNVKGISEALYSVTETKAVLTTEDVQDVAETINNIAEVDGVTVEVNILIEIKGYKLWR